MSLVVIKQAELVLSLGTEFEQMNDLFVNFDLSNYYEDLETSSKLIILLKNKRVIILKIY